MKNRHGPKGGRGSSVYRCSRRGDERVMRTNAEIAESNGGNSDDSRDDNDDDDDDDDGHKSGEGCDTSLEKRVIKTNAFSLLLYTLPSQAT